MKTNAYLILAHSKIEQLKQLIQLLDSKENDIYIHIDKKSKDIKIKDLANLTHNANIYIYKKYRVYWGGFSIVRAELLLLNKASQNKYKYYHLLSGVDLPLKSNKEIQEFFNNSNKEYIAVEPTTKEYIYNRARYYNFFFSRFKNRWISKAFNILNRIVIKLQKAVKIDRIKKCKYQIRNGDQWFSITHDSAVHLLSKTKDIKKIFKWTICPDESYKQTILCGSEYKNNIAYDDLRQIDWQRGNPYVYRQEDFDMLFKNNHNFFVRKLDSSIDNEIVQNIYNRISQQNQQN